MAHWKKMMDRDYIFAFDLDGKDVTLTIERVVAGTVIGERGKKNKKPVLFFKETKADETGKKKGLAYNTTNCKTTAALYGDEVDNWIGKRVTLYPTTTEFGGKTVDCIRVRPRIPTGATRNSRGTPNIPGLPEDGIVTRRPDLPEEQESTAPEPYDGPPGDEPEPREPRADG